MWMFRLWLFLALSCLSCPCLKPQGAFLRATYAATGSEASVWLCARRFAGDLRLLLLLPWLAGAGLGSELLDAFRS